jgi:pyrimidine-specific ribonucleoside hydrolase
MEETAPFPDEWRIFADELPRTELPEARRPVESRPAVDFLAEVLRGPARRRLVALGPLTNLARALERVPAAERRGLESLVVMGGAVSVEGNLGDGGYFRTNNTTAEWNMFVDPRAAELVFASGLPIVLIPLDATRRVPIRASFVRDFSRRATTPLGRFAAVLLDNAEELVQKALYYAWDPLVAVSLVHPEVVKLRPGAIQILRGAPTVGRTWLVSGKQPNAQIAFDADARLFGRVFTAAFVPGR